MKETIKRVEAAFRMHKAACKEAGLIPEGMHLELASGSQKNGRAWRLWMTGDRVKIAEHPGYAYPKGSGSNRPPVGDDYLGWTLTEARIALQERTAGM